MTERMPNQRWFSSRDARLGAQGAREDAPRSGIASLLGVGKQQGRKPSPRTLDPRIPDAHPRDAWGVRRQEHRLVSPSNRRNLKIIVVGAGLAGAGAATALAELGYQVSVFTFHDAPRRAHSIAAQGGINAMRGRKVDNDSLERFVADTISGGDFRAREAEAYRLATESARVIDHAAALGAPFAREYGGSMTTRSFGGVQVSRTYYTRGQTGQQLQLAASQGLMRQVSLGNATLHSRHEMLDLIVADGRAQGIVARNLVTGEITAHTAHAVILATGGYGSIYFHSTLARTSNASAIWRAHRRGALIASPSFVQFHPTALPADSPERAKCTLMSESLRNDGRVWVPATPGDSRAPGDIPEGERDYYLERRYPAFGNLTPRDIASRAATQEITAGRGVGPQRNSVYLDFADALSRLGADTLNQRYGNLFDMYADATGEDPLSAPMRIAPAAHFTMGGLWADFDLQTTIPGLFVGGEAGSSYHGANRLGANSLLSACVDGWFTLPFTVPNYLADLVGTPIPDPDSDAARAAVAEVEERTSRFLGGKGSRRPVDFHAELGAILRAGCGVERSDEGLRKARVHIDELREEFASDLLVTGEGERLNTELENAGRVADFLELADLMCVDALDRTESCGAHFRTESQTRSGEAKRNDEWWRFVSAWQSDASGTRHTRFEEPLEFVAVSLKERDYR
jgi:succinate dehydrogenase / fumarate reductase flavoprotein subunit